jgi:uncharacterized protein (TIGR02186 family)
MTMLAPKKASTAIVVTALAMLAVVTGAMLLPGGAALAGADQLDVTPAATSKQKRPIKRPRPEAKPAPAAPAAEAAPNAPQSAPAAPLPPERVEADVSARSIAVNAAFKGSVVTVFGTVDNSRQPSPEAGYYDVVVAVEGAPTPAIVRRKSNVAGLWINSAAASFDRVPSYYAVASTRPLEEIAEADVLAKYGIGLENIPLVANSKTTASTNAAELRDYQTALGRLKVREGLYTRDDVGVAFSGRSLFRSTLALPANVPVGQLIARVYLFREGALLSKFTTRVALERTGIERFVYESAHNSPWLYGIVAVVLALSCGLAASAIFGRVRL